MTLNEILDSVLLQSGVGTETAYTGTGDDEIERVVQLANQEAQSMSRHPWQSLLKTHTFTLSTDTQYDLPTDYRAMVPDTFYLNDRLYKVDYPTNASEWGYLQASSGGSGIRTKVRLLSDKITFYDPESGTSARFEYWSKHPVLATDGTTTKQYFTADTDTFILDDDLLVQRLIARYKRLVGRDDWQIDQAEAMRLESLLKGQDGGAKTVGPEDDHGMSPYYDLWRPYPNSP